MDESIVPSGKDVANRKDMLVPSVLRAKSTRSDWCNLFSALLSSFFSILGTLFGSLLLLGFLLLRLLLLGLLLLELFLLGLGLGGCFLNLSLSRELITIVVV